MSLTRKLRRSGLRPHAPGGLGSPYQERDGLPNMRAAADLIESWVAEAEARGTKRGDLGAFVANEQHRDPAAAPSLRAVLAPRSLWLERPAVYADPLLFEAMRTEARAETLVVFTRAGGAGALPLSEFRSLHGE